MVAARVTQPGVSAGTVAEIQQAAMHDRAVGEHERLIRRAARRSGRTG